jgi:hypothetical protein
MDWQGLAQQVSGWLARLVDGWRGWLPDGLPALQAAAPVLPLPAGLDTSHLLALAAALGWASGLRLYAVVFFTGVAGALGWVGLPDGLQLLQHPLVLAASGVMLVVEFLADKVPGLDTLWDTLHTVIRIPAGALLAGAVFGGDQAAWATVAALMGGTLAASAHVAKATTRAAVNTSPEPLSNIALSLVGDAAVPVMLWLSWRHPVAFTVCLVLAVVLGLVLTVLLFKFLKALWRGARRRFGGNTALPNPG